MPADVAVVAATVNVAVAADVPETVVEGAEQVSPVGEPVTEQEKSTCPVKPLVGLTVRVVVPLLPAGTVTAPAVMEKLGLELATTTLMAAVWMNLPEAPVTSTL